MSRYLAIGAALAIALLGVACFLLFKEVESLNTRAGKLEESNRQLTETVNAKIKASQGRATTDNTVRKLPPDHKLDGLR